MKTLLKIVGGIAAVIILIAIVRFGINVTEGREEVAAGQQWKTDKNNSLVTVLDVMRGDSVLIKYPGVFMLTKDALTSRMVVFRDQASQSMHAQADVWFAQKHTRVYTQ